MSFILRFRLPILVLFLTGTALLCSQLGKIRLTADPLGSMYPSGHPFLPALEAIREMAPEPRILIAVLEVKGGDIYNGETIRRIDSLTRALMRIEGVLPGGITSLTRGITHYENTAEGLAMEPILGIRWPETEQEFRELKRKVAVNPMGLGRYVSYDETAAMITAPLVEDAEGALLEPLLAGVEAIRSAEQDPGHRLAFMGPQLIEAQMRSMGRRQIPMAAAATLLLVVLALFVYFRTLRGVLLPVLVLTLTLLWTLGLLGATGFELNPMPLLFPLILALFSMVYGVLILDQYERAYPATEDRDRAILAAYGRTPLAVALATAGSVLASLFFAGAPLFRDLAWLGLFWLLSTAAVVVLLLPVLLSVVRPPTRGRAGRGDPCRFPSASLLRLSRGRGRSLLLGLLAAVLALGALSARWLEVGDNVPGASYIRADHPWNQCFRLLAEKFMGPYQFLVHVRANEPAGLLDPEAVHAVGDFSRYLRTRGGARDCIAFDMMVKTARRMMMDGNPKWQTVPLSREQVKGMGELVVEQGGVEGFIDRTFTEATLSPFFPESGARRIAAYASRMQAYIDRNPSDRLVFRLGGGLLGMTKALDDGTRSAYWRTLAVAFGLVVLFGALATGSPGQGLVIALPIAAAQAGVWMILVVAGMKVNMPVTVVSAATVGFCSLFVYARIREIGMASHESDCLHRNGDRGFRRAGGIVPFLGFLVFFGLLPWFFIGLRFPSQMALYTGITVPLAALGSALFVPALAGPRGTRASAGLPGEERG